MTTEEIKQKVIEMLRNEKWYPAIKPTELEFETSKLLNAILEDIVSRVIKL